LLKTSFDFKKSKNCIIESKNDSFTEKQRKDATAMVKSKYDLHGHKFSFKFFVISSTAQLKIASLQNKYLTSINENDYEITYC
jgi:hypothetical protein